MLCLRATLHSAFLILHSLKRGYDENTNNFNYYGRIRLDGARTGQRGGQRLHAQSGPDLPGLPGLQAVRLRPGCGPARGPDGQQRGGPHQYGRRPGGLSGPAPHQPGHRERRVLPEPRLSGGHVQLPGVGLRPAPDGPAVRPIWRPCPIAGSGAPPCT